MNVQMLAHTGYVSVQYSESLRVLVHQAMNSWSHFCALPTGDKNRCSVTKDRDTDFGYMFRGDTDNKELFHVSRRDMRLLMIKAYQIKDHRAIEFIRATDLLIHQIQSLIVAFARKVESVFGIFGFADAVTESSSEWTLRYLHYFGGEELAGEHIDRGGFTLHVYESHPGGEYLDFNGVWKPFPISHGETIIFPGVGLQYRSDCALKALWHRIVATPETKINGRLALVLFVDVPGFTCLNIKKKFGGYPSGFNYTMPRDEFVRICDT